MMRTLLVAFLGVAAAFVTMPLAPRPVLVRPQQGFLDDMMGATFLDC